VVAGEPLTLWRVPPDQEPSNLTLSILWQDDHLVVFDKPPGIAVHPSARYYRSTLTQLLRRWHFPPSPAPDAVRLPRPAHRLDRETSGVLLCCRTTSSERTWKARFLSARVHKTYLALCQGVPPWSSTTITIPLAVRPHSVVRIKVGPTDHGLPATTHVRVAWSGKDRSLLVCHPQTGRTHQIRAHLSLAGFPVVGDKLYGPLGDDWFARYADHGLAHDAAAQLGHTRHALHAAVLAGEDHSFVAPWPADLAALSPEAAAAAQDLLQEHAATASLAPRSWGRPTR
jgi:23S rRNA pseudouridine1911/1915/1917 synthase